MRRGGGGAGPRRGARGGAARLGRRGQRGCPARCVQHLGPGAFLGPGAALRPGAALGAGSRGSRAGPGAVRGSGAVGGRSAAQPPPGKAGSAQGAGFPCRNSPREITVRSGEWLHYCAAQANGTDPLCKFRLPSLGKSYLLSRTDF